MYSVYIHHIDTKLSISYRQLTNRHLRFYFIFTKRKISNLFQFSFFRFINNKTRCCYQLLLAFSSKPMLPLRPSLFVSFIKAESTIEKDLVPLLWAFILCPLTPLTGARFVNKKGCGGSGKRRIRGRKGGRVGIRGIKVMRIWIYRP